jgi:hypothetical protein
MKLLVETAWPVPLALVRVIIWGDMATRLYFYFVWNRENPQKHLK